MKILAKAGDELAKDHYRKLELHAGECVAAAIATNAVFPCGSDGQNERDQRIFWHVIGVFKLKKLPVGRKSDRHFFILLYTKRYIKE